MDGITIKLKKMLLSRNFVLQDKCIQFMIRSLKDPKQFDLVSTTYLNADMIQYLCEPLLLINIQLIQSICLCLWMLSKNNKFYERNDVLYTCNSVLRTLVFLINNKNSLVSDLIQLLTIIIKKGGKNLREICNTQQVLTIIKMIFKNSHNLPGRCVINAVSILTCFLSCPSIELSSKLYSTCMFIAKAICKNVSGKYTVDPHMVDIASDLSNGLLRLYSTIGSRILIDVNLKKHGEMAIVLKNIAWYMIKHISLPFVLKNMNINMYYKSYRRGIKSLISPFRESLSTRVRQNIAKHYAASRIIRILYELIEFNQVGVLVEELLFEMSFYLSTIYLEINSHWPGGTDMFRNQIIWSFKHLPKTPKDICSVLVNSKNTDMKHAIIIFLYFYLLTCSNVENESIYLEPMCAYLYSSQNEMPITIIKAILFNVSISFVSHHAVNAISGLSFATKKLVTLMNPQNVELVFTLHPALLYFLFATSLIPEEIKLKLIKYWIHNLDDISSVELEKFCLKNCKAKICLLNVLINDSSINSLNLKMGFNIVKQIITTEHGCNEHNTLLDIWNMLPSYLGSFCCGENLKVTGVTNLRFLLNLTESFSLHGLDIFINEHRNIVYTMSLIIKSYQSTFTEQHSLLSSLLQHFIILIQLSDGDVLNTIKKNKDFLCVLQNLCLSENNDVCYLTFKTIIKLCQLEKKETKRKHKLLNSITLKCESVLNAMSRLCYNCITSSMILLQIVIKYYEEDDISKMVEFNDSLTVEFLKSVFIKLETIISQGLDWVSDFAWDCMMTILSTKLFKHLQELSEIQFEFATDPWLTFLIANLKTFNEKCLEFLHYWITQFVINKKESFTIYGEKTLCSSLFDKTIIQISIVLVDQVYEHNELLSKAKMVINLVLKNKFCLPNELECKMKNFLN